MTVLSDTCHLSKALQVSESQLPVRKGELQPCVLVMFI